MSAWTDVTAAYLAHLRAQSRSERTLALTTHWLGSFAEFSIQAGVKTVSGVTARHLATFQSQLWWQTGPQGRLYSPNSRYQCLQMVRAFLRWAFDTGRHPRNVTADLVLRRPVQPTPPILTTAQAATLLSHPDPQTVHGLRDGLLLALVYQLGLEPGELRRLEVADVDAESGLLRVEHGKPRTLRLPPSVTAALVEYLARRAELAADGEAALLVGGRGRRWGLDLLNLTVRHHARMAGLGEVTLQALRRSGVAYHFQQGESLESIQARLGHRHPANTLAYRPNEGPVVVPAQKPAPVHPGKTKRLPLYTRAERRARAQP